MTYSELYTGRLEQSATPAALDVGSFCMHSIRTGLYEIYDRLDNLQLEEYDGAAVGRIILGMAGNAAEAGDIQRAEAGIDMLRRIPDVPNSIFAATCFAGVTAGSHRAFDILRGALEAEKLNLQRQNTPGERRAGHACAKSSAGTLKGLIYACAERSVPPDVWIEEYAADKEGKWQLYMQYYDLMDEMKGHNDDDTYQQRLEQKVSELIEPGEYAEAFVYGQAGYALQLAESPELRQRLIERFRQTAKKVPLTSNTFRDLLWLGLDVIRDPALTANEDNVIFFEKAIERGAFSLRVRNVLDSFELARSLLLWQIGLKVHNGAASREVRDDINLMTSRLLPEDMPDDPGRRAHLIRSKKKVEKLRDDLLAAYADNYSDAGDFASARIFIYDMVDEAGQQYALKSCLDKANNLDELEAVRPDEVTLSFRPGLHPQFKFAEAFLANDLGRLRALALGYARTVGEGIPRIKREYIRDAYETYASADRPDAAVFARELLTTLRQAGEHYDHVSYLSDALIKAGDPAEPAEAYMQINRCFENSSERLYHMWRLAGLLRGQSGLA